MTIKNPNFNLAVSYFDETLSPTEDYIEDLQNVPEYSIYYKILFYFNFIRE